MNRFIALAWPEKYRNVCIDSTFMQTTFIVRLFLQIFTVKVTWVKHWKLDGQNRENSKNCLKLNLLFKKFIAHRSSDLRVRCTVENLNGDKRLFNTQLQSILLSRFVSEIN